MKRRPFFYTPSSSFSIPCLFYYTLCIILVLLSSPTRSITLVEAQQDQSVSILDTLFNNDNTNFTQCSNANTFVVHDLNRTYDHATNTFFFNLSGHSPIAVTNLNQGQNQYSSARTEVVIGFNALMDQRQRLCPTLNNSNSNGCPIEANSNVSIQQSYTLPETSLPLGNIIARYSTLTADNEEWICITMAPVGYQNPTWKIVFTYVPVAFTIFAALVSFFASFATVSEAEHDVFLFTSNYAMLPAALRLKSPGFFDLIYYAQFIVLSGQLNLNYPEFYQLFVSNFAWSYLLFPTQWLRNINDSIFPYKPEQQVEDVMAVTLLDQQQNTSSVIVQGQGLAKFANAVDMDVNNLFLASFIFMLIILAGCLLLCFVIWMVVQIQSWRAPHRYAAQTPKIINFTIGIILRVLTLFYLPMMVLGFFQLMLPAPWYLLLNAALVLVFHIFLVYGVIAFILLDVRPPSLVFSDITLLLRYGCLYNTFTDESFYFFLCDLVYRIFIGAMTGWFSVSGVAQMTVILIFEAAYFTLHILRRPYASRHVNIQHIIFGAFRLVILFLNIGYLDSLEALDRNKQALAYTQITLHCIVFLMMFLFPIRNLVVLLTGLADDEINETGAPPARMAFWRRKRHPEENGKMRHNHLHHRVPTNDELDKFAEQQRFQQRQQQQQYEQEQEYQQLHNKPPPPPQQQRLSLQLQQEPMMEVISLRDERPSPVAFASSHNKDHSKNNKSIHTDDNRTSSRSSLPPPPPPPHRVKSNLELRSNIEQRNGWKLGGRNRHSVLGINPTQQESATATVVEPLMSVSPSSYYLQRQQQQQPRPTSWGSTLSTQQQYQQQYQDQRNNNHHRPFSFQ